MADATPDPGRQGDGAPGPLTLATLPGGGAEDRERARLVAVHDYVDVQAPPSDDLKTIVRLATRVTGLPYGVVNIIDERYQRQIVAEGFDRSVCAREHSMCAQTVALGALVAVDDASLDPRFAANPWVDGRLSSVRSYVSAPLITPEGHTLGSLCVFDVETVGITDRVRRDLSDLADLVVVVLQRERILRHEALTAAELRQSRQAVDTAHALQEALLPRRLPWSEAVSLAARYLPGGDNAEVGGDFYDAVRTDDAVVVVVGDVQGHNAAATALMGQVRTAVRAYVAEGHSPGAVLERTNRLLALADTDLFTTCCLLRLDEFTGEVTVASAGHPVPLLFDAEKVVPLDVEAGPPLGVQPDVVFTEGRHRLSERSRLLLYTDGVLAWPRRSQGVVDPLDDVDPGLATLEAVLRAYADVPAEDLTSRVMDPASRTRTDDAALVVVDYSGPVADRWESRLSLSDDVRSVARGRKHLRETLRRWELPDAVDLAELVASELVTNALVHTATRAVLVLQYRTSSRTLLLGVEDSSTSHPRPRDADDDALGGRGLGIVEVVAERWWVSPRGDGKTVWAELRL
ncbi:SpoIIE family protein phosphatase [Kineococcus gynurae]|uniref:SpoIIE family protein phosphatase n=1 Tax=Kineococcus gynurae TaxID=452979 RepID=A0ABV5LP26_9ACTN